MKKTSKFISIIISIMMLMQITAFNVSAQELEAYWGQDFPDEEWTWGTGEAVFWDRADISNYEFKLFKDNVEVYSNRIEEGVWGSANEGDWYAESLFLAKFAEYGSGAYTFSVSTLDGTGFDIEDAEITDTAKSGIFNYVKPSSNVSIPKLISNSADTGIIYWEKGDDDTFAYLVDAEIDYGNGVSYDPDYEELYVWDEWSEYDVKEYDDFLTYLAEYNPQKYPKENAKFKIRLRALPEDITQFNPSGYTDWIVSEYKFTSGGTDITPTPAPAEEPLDRTVVSKSYYDAAKLLYDLNVMPDIYSNYNKTITTGDMAIVMVKLLGMTESAEELKNTKIFSDVEVGTELNGCVNAMYYTGYMRGMGDGTFGAVNEMTAEQVIKVLVTALGYELYANQYGGYPNGYLMVARNYNIDKGVTYAVGDTITFEQLAQLVRNSLEIGMLKQTSWGVSGAIYEVTDDTLLYRGLGIEKIIGTVKVDTKASVNGFGYSDDHKSGYKIIDKDLVVKDKDIFDYEKDFMLLYTDGENILSGFEYEGYAVLVNGGNKDATRRVVEVDVIANNYTKFKCSQTQEYINIGETGYCLLSDLYEGKKTVNVYLSNDDETNMIQKSYKINFVNKHTVKYMVNGELYQSYDIGYGKSIAKPSNPNVLGYTFEEWEGLPSTMPNKDITVHAKLTPNVVYSGIITSNGKPVSASIYENGNWLCSSNSSTGEFSFEIKGGRALIRIAGNVQKLISLNATEGKVDLGVVELDSVDERMNVYQSDVVGAEYEKQLLNADYSEYAKTEGNGVSLIMDLGYPYSNTNIENEMAQNYQGYKECTKFTIGLTRGKTGEVTESEKVDKTETNMEFSVKLDSQYYGMDEYVVLRDCDGTVDALTVTPNADDEYIEIVDNVVTIYAKQFSTFSIIANKIEKPSLQTYSAEAVWNELDTVTVNVTEPEKVNENAAIYLALYDENGALVKVYKKDNVEETNTFKSDYRASEVRAFVWDDLNPLAK